MRVLVTGAHGFIGSRIVDALQGAGHEVIAAVRAPKHPGQIACNLASDVDSARWYARLDGIDAVVNCAGILREYDTERFQAIHVDAPLALFRACVQRGVRRVVQISALGEAQDGEFIASKHRADTALMQLDLDWTVVRPGLVYSASGAYGGTSLLRALAVLPVSLLPLGGRQKMKPVTAEDVGIAVVASISRTESVGQVIELVGPQTVTFADYQRRWRAWFELPETAAIALPWWFVALSVAVGEWCTRGPLCRVIARLLDRERLGAADASERIAQLLGFVPRSLEQALRERPMRAGELRDAQLYIFLPLLRGAFALVWIVSGLLGLLMPAATAAAMLPQFSVPWVRGLAIVTGAADLALGILLLLAVQVRRIELAMLAMTLAYTLGLSLLAPLHWLDPFGGLLKNLVLVAALGILLVLEPRK